MKQQQHDDTALYRELRGAFRMSPEQKLRVEQEIRRRTNAAMTANVQTVRDSTPEIKKSHGAYWYASRVLPMAACLVLVCAGAFFLHRGFTEPADSLEQQDSVEMEEILPVSTVTATGTAAADTTATTAYTTVSGQITTAADPVLTTAAPNKNTEAETEAPAETQPVNDESPEDRTTAQSQTLPTTQDVTTAHKTTTVPTTTKITTTKAITTTVTTTTAVTETEPQFRLVDSVGEANITIPDVTANAGETVCIHLLAQEGFTAAGAQFSFRLQSSGDIPTPPLRLETRAIERILLEQGGSAPITNVESVVYPQDNVILVYADTEEIEIPAGTELMNIYLEIPADVPAGTVYQFVPEDFNKITGHSEAVDDSGAYTPIRAYLGTITVN